MTASTALAPADRPSQDHCGSSVGDLVTSDATRSPTVRVGRSPGPPHGAAEDRHALAAAAVDRYRLLWPRVALPVSPRFPLAVQPCRDELRALALWPSHPARVPAIDSPDSACEADPRSGPVLTLPTAPAPPTAARP